MSKIKKLFSFKVLIFSSVLVVTLVLWSNYCVDKESDDYVFNSISDVPKMKVGLVLGTSAVLKNGNPNPFFTFRINSIVALYEANKIEHVLISGDNGTKTYNEPEDMRDALVARGIPLNKITLDYAGFDTYDSVLRANKVFGLSDFIVVSQEFHVRRAVYIARRNDLNVVGFNAKDVSQKRSFLTHFREYFARVKAYVEVKLNVDPYFLGEPIQIP